MNNKENQKKHVSKSKNTISTGKFGVFGYKDTRNKGKKYIFEDTDGFQIGTDGKLYTSFNETFLQVNGFCGRKTERPVTYIDIIIF